MQAWLVAMMTGTRYPVVNPEAVHVEAQTGLRYDRDSESYIESERAPKTWVSDTLRVAAVPDCRGRKFLFTGAQNDAAIHHQFWENLQAYAQHIGADIVVGPWTYETSWFNENAPSSRDYAEEISDYIAFGQMEVGNNFIFAGEMNTLPTAARPISDLATYSRGRWAVFPHAKFQLKSVPSTDPAVQAHQVMTTGAVTLPKVIPRKAGIKSIFHHIIGATIVEFDHVGDIFARQICASDEGSFYDLDCRVTHGVVTKGHRARAITCADIHVRKLDSANTMATFGWDMCGGVATYRDSVLDALNPEHVIVHDIYDNESRNHHHVNDSAYSYEMAYRRRDNVESEVCGVGQFLDKVSGADRTVIVAEGNHDIGLEKYVREGRYRNDGSNVRFGLQMEDAYLGYVEIRSAAIDSGRDVPRFSLLEHAIRLKYDLGTRVEWCHDGYSRLIDGIEVGNHGFRGANGAKGSVSGFARVGRKMSIGDKHSPEIMEGVYVAGAMNLRHGYNKGASGWAVTHIVQYQDGKRTLITLQNGKWRAAKPVVRVPIAANDNELLRRAA